MAQATPHPRFQSTPRFGSSSAPRPTQARESLSDDVDDDEDDDDDGLVADSSATAVGDGRRAPQDSIEVDSEGASTSQGDEGHSSEFSDLGNETHGAEDALPREKPSPEARVAKRRRISISPVGELSPAPGSHEDAEAAFLGDDAFGSAVEGAAAPADAAEVRHAQQPVFRPAPRFKPNDDDDDDDNASAAARGAPSAAFSPQRRGVRFLLGELASELQGWLSEVKGWDSSKQAPDADALRIAVQEVRPGRHMHLVRGRVDTEDVVRGFILAGPGRPTGPEGSTAAEGSVVVAGPPVWDVEV